MTTSSSQGRNAGWHADQAAIQGWVDGSAGPLLSASVEQHLLGCAHCRTQVAAAVAVDSLEPVWDRVAEVVEVPTHRPLERLLVRLGMRPSEALLVAAAPSMRLSWLSALATTMVFAAVAASYGGPRGMTLFLLIAPLVPVVGVAASYGPSIEPSYEVEAATPYPAFRLVLHRTATVLVASVPVVLVVGLLPLPVPVSAAWLLPALGFVAVVLLASTWVDPVHAAVSVGLAWLAAVVWATRSGDPLLVVQPGALAAYALLTVLAVALLVVRLRSAGLRWLPQ